jgi:hypothetical protein
LTLDEKTQVMIFFQYAVKDLVEEVIAMQGDFVDQVIAVVFRRRGGVAAGVARLIRGLFRPVAAFNQQVMFLAFDQRTREAVIECARNNPLVRDIAP